MKYVVTANYDQYCFDKMEDATAFAVMAKTHIIDRRKHGVNVAIELLDDEKANERMKEEI